MKYTRFILTVIAVELGAITAKLYIPVANWVGPRLGAPTAMDRVASRDLPVVMVRDGSITVDGSVEVSGGPVEIEGTVQVER